MPTKSVQDIYSRESAREEKKIIAKEQRIQDKLDIEKRSELLKGISNNSDTELEDVILKKVMKKYVRSTFNTKLESLGNTSVNIDHNKINYWIYLNVEVLNNQITLSIRKVDAYE